MNVFVVYLLFMLPSFKAALDVGVFTVGIGLIVTTVLSIIFFIVRTLIGYLNCEEETEIVATRRIKLDGVVSNVWKYIRRVGYVYAFAVCVAVLIPQKEQLLGIVGVVMVTNIQGIEKMPSNIVNAMNVGLERLADMSVETTTTQIAAPVK